MPMKTKYVFEATMDVTAEKEDLFNEVYDTEHVPALLKVPGVIAVSRLKREAARICLGGEEIDVADTGLPRYSALYEIESPEVLTSTAWAQAVELGRWAAEVRPHTSNRHHILRKVV